jgi:cell division transport system permease protein
MRPVNWHTSLYLGVQRRTKAEMALVPKESIAGRALVTVVAIMTFLASLAAGAAILISDTSRGWQDTVAREMTIQIRPAP